MSKVSIIVPVYNGEKVLQRCVDSILTQDYKDIEVILVDDGSKDTSFKIISEYAQKDNRVVPVHKNNGGVSSTRNKALSMASGDYIQFLDVDDWLPFDSTKQLVRAMEENDAQMVIGDFYRVVDDTISKKGSIKDDGLISRNEYADKMMLTPADFYYGVLWNKLYRKDIIDKYNIRMDENISYCEDTIFNLEYLLHVDNIYVLKVPVYYYVKTEGSLVSQNLNLESTVNMKTSVIKYYNQFYKNILDEEAYENRKLFIYSYLVSFSTDSLSIPFFEAKKLGKETGNRIYYDKQLSHNEWMADYLKSAFLDQLLNTVAQQSKLDLNEVKILYFLYKKNKECSTDELCSLSELKISEFSLAIAKLLALSYIKIADLNIFEEKKIRYVYNPSKVSDLLKNVDSDYEAVAYEGFTKKEKEDYLSSRDRILENISKRIVK